MKTINHLSSGLLFCFLALCACGRSEATKEQSKVTQNAETITEAVKTKAEATEKDEGSQDLVKDKVSLNKTNTGAPVIEQTGEASSYGQEFHGKTTASGETFNKNEMTAAHPTLPLGTKAKVTNLDNRKSVDVRINDRGPYLKGRDIDVSQGAAEKLALTKSGVAPVKIEAEIPSSKTLLTKSGNSTPSNTPRANDPR